MDVAYDELISRPLDVLATLYARFDWSITDAQRARWSQFLAGERTRRAGESRNAYALSDFGLTRESTRAAFRDYLERAPVRWASICQGTMLEWCSR